MFRKIMTAGSCFVFLIFLTGHAWASCPGYSTAKELGAYAAAQAAEALDAKWEQGNCIALTNAGYARPDGQPTLGCLDGVGHTSKTSVGQKSLIRLQSRFDQPLWFAFYHRDSGRCAYYQLDADQAANVLVGKRDLSPDIFTRQDTARIEAEYLFTNPEKFQQKSEKGLFGPNLFRVVTAANAADRKCPDHVLAALQIHDHYCPGVSSGLLLAAYVQEHILKSSPQTKCFVLSINPWCKEDALTTLLNATPGKRAYGVLYPTKEEVKSWPQPMNRVDTVVFTQEEGGKKWHGWLLGFDFDQARKMQDLPKFDSVVVDKLAADLWFMDRLDRPEQFVVVHKKVKLGPGESPKELLRPGNNPVQILADM